MGMSLGCKETMSEHQMCLLHPGWQCVASQTAVHIEVMHQWTGECENANLAFGWVGLQNAGYLHRDFGFVTLITVMYRGILESPREHSTIYQTEKN